MKDITGTAGLSRAILAQVEEICKLRFGAFPEARPRQHGRIAEIVYNDRDLAALAARVNPALFIFEEPHHG